MKTLAKAFLPPGIAAGALVLLMGLGFLVSMSGRHWQADGRDGNAAVLVIGGVFSIFLYFAPTIAAGARDSRLYLPILVGNVALGWTGLGWIGCLIAALWPNPSKAN